MKNNFLVFGIAALVAFFLGSCSSGRELDASEYVAWANAGDSPLRQSRQFGDYTFTAELRPAELMVALEGKSKGLSQSQVDHRLSELEGMKYFLLRIEPTRGNANLVEHGARNQTELQEKLYYFNYDMKSDLFLLSGSRRIPCELYHFERSFDMSQHRNFVLGFPFPQKSPSGDLVLELDSRLFGAGAVRFAFSQETLENLPTLSVQP